MDLGIISDLLPHLQWWKKLHGVFVFYEISETQIDKKILEAASGLPLAIVIHF
jgi:hypothetical protein